MSEPSTNNQIGLTSSPDFVAGISDGAVDGPHAFTMLGNAEQNGRFWGFLGHFEPLLSEIFTTSYGDIGCANGRRESTRLRKNDVAWGHSDVAIIVTIKIHSLPLYVHFKIMEDFKNERKPIHS